MVECKGDDDLEDFDEILKTLTTDVTGLRTDVTGLRTDVANEYSVVHFTSCRDLIAREATVMAIELANRAFSHSLTAIDDAKGISALDTDLFAYSVDT